MSKELKLLLNLEDSGHSDEIGGFLADAEHLECMVAFAKISAKDTFLTPFKQAIARGMTARVAIGLSLFVTDPAMLNGLLELQKKIRKACSSISAIQITPFIQKCMECVGRKDTESS